MIRKASFILSVPLASVIASAGISPVHIDSQNLSSTVLTNTFTKTVQAGDVVVMTAAGNKKYSVAPVSFSSTAGSPAVFITLAGDPFPASYAAYLTIETNGTYDFTAVAAASITAKSGIHVLTDDYTVPDWACNTYRAMIEALVSFEKDLHQHIHKENNVLFPRALRRENNS